MRTQSTMQRRFANRGPAMAVILAGTLAGFAGSAAAQQTVAAPTASTATAPAAGTPVNGTVYHLVGPGIPPVDAHQTIRGNNNQPIFQVLGFTGQIAAPVDAAYNSENTYNTFAGQPGRGSTAVLANSMDGSP